MWIEGGMLREYGDIDEDTEDQIKGMAAATENYGNFFAQNCFMVLQEHYLLFHFKRIIYVTWCEPGCYC